LVKVLLGWNILPGQEKEYFDFYVEEFEPGLAGMGLQTTDVWYTTYGDWPQIVTGVLASDLATARQIFVSEQWSDLKVRLLKYVSDFQQKAISASGGYQL
jgi:hypothetical protein